MNKIENSWRSLRSCTNDSNDNERKLSGERNSSKSNHRSMVDRPRDSRLSSRINVSKGEIKSNFPVKVAESPLRAENAPPGGGGGGGEWKLKGELSVRDQGLTLCNGNSCVRPRRR